MPRLLHHEFGIHPRRIGSKRRTLPRIAKTGWRFADSRMPSDPSHIGFLCRSGIVSDARSLGFGHAFHGAQVFVS
jgi:hypothetical protein